MEKKLDFRVQRTYKTLQDALIRLLREKRFEEITVGELCETAMIRRATFYKHFGDKYELFSFTVREFLKHFNSQGGVDYDLSDPQSFYTGMVDYTLRFVEQNEDIFQSLMKSNNAQILFDILSNEVERDIGEHLKEDVKNGVNLPARTDLMASIFTGALIYTVKWWIVHDKQLPREELVQVCSSMMKFL
ncbi:MAG: TetR/AcrR family transcriptional regulator [Oscillospiraceae bacterium]|nr:TetR/AcrR family transcriptional regulator [Oscillospiraceae bacterium]